jgi:hypothetical protein
MKVTVTEHTVDTVTERISQLCSISASELRQMTAVARAMRAATLAELYEHRARLFAGFDLMPVPVSSLDTVAMAMQLAAKGDQRSAKFWWAEARR